jgi:exodeoxyribonuclease III
MLDFQSHHSATAMKIATYNINDINKRLANLLEWLAGARPDVVCLQELKAAQNRFPVAAIEKAGYGAAWRGQKTWNGVAILGRDREPIVTRDELPGDPPDTQSRYLEAAVSGTLVASIYAPNGNPQPGPKFDYKLAWLERLARHAAELYGSGLPVVLAGDFNVVPTERDIYPTKSYARDAVVQPQSRAAFRRILDQGWVDAIRAVHPDAPIYTYWDYKRNCWPRNAGMRLDHLLLSRESAKRLVDAGVNREVRGAEGASDHAPAWIILRDEANAAARNRSRAMRPARKTAARVVDRTAASRARRPLLVVDGDSFAHRAYHALPKTILGRGGKPAGAILGFANILLRLYQDERPRAVLVCWDTLEAPTYRHVEFPAYQGGREFDDELVEQLDVLPEFVAALGFANARAPGYEADDFLAAAVAAEERRGGSVLVASGDRDTFQLASAKTTILFPVRGGGTARIGPTEVRERYGVEPKQVPDFIAIRGDPSDKLPGVPGIGPTGAASLLRQYGTLEKALKAGRFPAHAKRLRLFRSIATMDRSAPLPKIGKQEPAWDKAAVLARAWDLKQLAGRLEKLSPLTGG